MMKILPSAAVATALAAFAFGCGGAGEPAAGKCTNADPDLGVQVVGIEVVDCDDSKATTKIVREVENGADCQDGRMSYGEQTFCTEPLKK
ncbi:MAG TPA: hypothetical protein VM266_01700 [Solirubrobacteraceae bacterium]|nr:hypothetical protein [Solirubrobacteraceae bacterium]